jgi:hypothetical protein
MKTYSKLLPITLLFVATLACAGPKTYECTILEAGEVNARGKLDLVTESKKKTLLSSYVGSKFTIERQTGKLIGDWVNNQTPNEVSTKVLNNETGSNAYRVISHFGPNPSIIYIQVNDYARTDNKTAIPFIGFRWSEVLSGVCK